MSNRELRRWVAIKVAINGGLANQDFPSLDRALKAIEQLGQSAAKLRKSIKNKGQNL